MLYLEFIFDRTRRGVAAQPELLDELLAFFIGLETFECGALFIGDDVGNVFVEPLEVRRFELFAELLLALPDFLWR